MAPMENGPPTLGSGVHGELRALPAISGKVHTVIAESPQPIPQGSQQKTFYVNNCIRGEKRKAKQQQQTNKQTKRRCLVQPVNAVLGLWLQPGLALAVECIWRVNQPMVQQVSRLPGFQLQPGPALAVEGVW